MNKFTKAFHRGEKGFTLIELLIVIVILGILSAVAIPQVTKFIRSGKVSAGNSELALMNTAMGTLMADAQLTSLSAVPVGPPIVTVSGLTAGSVAGVATDITIVVGGTTYKLSDYITGGVNAVKGSYTFSNASPNVGVVTSATYPGVSAVDATHPAFY